MAFDWSEFLVFAKHIKDNSDTMPNAEACFRTAVSRAYYSAFCMTRRHVENTDGAAFDGGDAHKKLREHLKKSGDTLKRKIANQLEGLHFNRKKADYDDTLREKPRNMAAKAVAAAEKIMAEVADLR